MKAAASGRKRVLGAVRRALNGHASGWHSAEPPAGPASKSRPIFDREHFVDLLREHSCAVAQTDSMKRVPTLVAAHLRLVGLPLRVAVESGELAKLGWQDADVDATAVWDEDLRAAVALCRAGIAETGQLVVDSLTDANIFSLLPQCHIAVLDADLIRPSLDDLADIIGTEPPGVVTLIAGPSRTGDIEQQLVIGAHGPRDVLAVIVGD